MEVDEGHGIAASPPRAAEGGDKPEGCTALQAYLSSVGDALTPPDDHDSANAYDEDDSEDETEDDSDGGSQSDSEALEREDGRAGAAGSPESGGAAGGSAALRAELQSTKEILSLALNDMKSRFTRDAESLSEVNRIATSIMGSARGIEQAPPKAPQSDASTQTDACPGLEPLSLRVEDAPEMVRLMCLTARVAASVAKASGSSGAAPPPPPRAAGGAPQLLAAAALEDT